MHTEIPTQWLTSMASDSLFLAACLQKQMHTKIPNQCLTSMVSNRLFLAACLSFSMATSPTCRTLSLDKPILKIIDIQQPNFKTIATLKKLDRKHFSFWQCSLTRALHLRTFFISKLTKVYNYVAGWKTQNSYHVCDWEHNPVLSLTCLIQSYGFSSTIQIFQICSFFFFGIFQICSQFLVLVNTK